TRLVGRLMEEHGIQFVVAENKRISQDILIPPTAMTDKRAKLKARPGNVVMVEILEQPSRYSQPIGRIVEILGNYADPGMEIEIALRKHDLPFEFSKEAQAENKAVPDKVKKSDFKGREDLRELPLVTIDGETARDFDDAVFCEKVGRGWRLVVAIADVSHYVRPGMALDREAYDRGNSVYFPRRVIPMLPEKLSNGICSLNPDVERLAMVCDMNISATGSIGKYRFYPAVFRSHARLTYNQVWGWLSGESQPENEVHQALQPHLQNLYKLFQVLLKARHTRGAIDFETQETRIVFGADRKIAAIKPTERNDAHKLIEECMLCANVATAAFLQKHEIPALYRVHDAPPLERQEKLRAFLGELGLSLHKGKEGPTPKDYQALLEKIQGRPDFHVIQTVMLRSLSQAVYSAENHGHFGLNYEAYAHFTSPIRRYPDLLVHRAIRSVIRSRRDTPHVRREGAPSMPKARIYPYDEAALEQLGEQCSMTERRADEATRDVVNWLKCEFMKDRVGETFPGVITAVTGFGLFVELTDIYVEGLVHVTAMPGDYYHFDPLHHRLSGERSGRSFRLGDSVEVRVMRVDLDERKIDFELIAGGSKTAGQRDSGERGREPGNADIRKSRELKQALMAEAKSGGRKGKADKAVGSKSRSGASKPKSAGKPAEKSPASSGGPRKRKAKS
ncbi:MAG: ribonuclease R, partial [Stutzerimonas stutzeri]